MDRFEYKEAIEDAVKYHLSIIPKEVKELIAKANHDLYCGPSYYDKEGNECSCFDEEAIPFNFTEALKIISEYIDTIDDITEEIYCDDDGETAPHMERIDGSREEIMKELFGKELIQYCR